MKTADEQYNHIINEINNNGEWDFGEDVRGVYESDGAPAHTKSIFGHQVEFKNGRIPLVTSKQVFVKTAAKEMWLFWMMQTVKERDFKDNNVKIWNQWFKDGNLGRSYAYQFESHRHHERDIVKVSRRVKAKHGELGHIVVDEMDDISNNMIHEDIGLVYPSKNCGDAVVVHVYKSGEYYEKSIGYIMQFMNTGTKIIVQKGDAKIGNMKDRYARTVYGVGYRGNDASVKNYTDNERKHLYDVWVRMLERCYKEDSKRYSDYGGNGVFVSEEWHSFENFLREIRYIPQFFLAKEKGFKGFHLDKDYYGSNCYSKETCVWLSVKENLLYSGNYGKPFIVTDEHGEIKLFIEASKAIEHIGVERSYFYKKLKTAPVNIKGYKVETVDDGALYRYELSRNQVVELLQGIKHNSQSRRLGTSFWNFADVNKKQLQECAHSTLWNVKNNNLDLLLIQRSVDVGLGLVFNWIQYWILGQVIAHVNGLTFRNFKHQMGSVHYYDRHEEGLLKQKDLPTYDEPIIKINQGLKDFFDFTPDDLIIENYKHGEYIFYEVAV